MSQAKGYMGRTTLFFEPTYKGTPSPKNGLIIPFNKNTVQLKQGIIKTNTILNRRDAAKPGLGRKTADGALEVPSCYRTMGYILKAILGAPTTTGAGPKYTHVFKISKTATQPSVKIEKAFTDIGKYYLAEGVKIVKLSTKYGIGDSEHIHTIDLFGSTETSSGTEYDSAATPVVLNRMNDYQASIKEGGSTVTNIANIEFSLDMGLDLEQFAIGSENARADIPEGQVVISGKLTALFTDTAILEKAVAGTKSSIEIISEDVSGNSLAYKLPEIMYSVTSPPIEGPTGVRVDADFSAFYENDAGDSSAIITLVNDVASYALA